MKNKEGTKLCKHCKTEIPAGAKICPNCRKKQGLGGCLTAFIAVIVISAMFSALGGGSDSASDDSPSLKNTEADAPQTEAPKATLQTEPEETDDGIIDVTINDCHIVYIKHEIETNMADDTCVVVYYQFTNNSKENQSFIYTVGETAFQDGIELKNSLFHVNDESKDRSAEIQPGKTITVASAFVIRDDSADVELQISPLISFSEKPKDSMILEIK